MSKETRSLLVWLMILFTVVSSAAVFLFSFPDFTNVVKVDYGKPLTDIHITSKHTQTTSAVAQFPIDINIASKDDLMRIKGIGDVYADRIIAYREEIGGFSALEQLTEIQGIGEKRLETWREYLVCE